MPTTKIKISLTDFVDFVSKAGNSKFTKVKTVKKRPPYHPAQDYYKFVREMLIDILRSKGDKTDILKELKNNPDPRKEDNFLVVGKGFKKFWGRKDLKWFEPPYERWTKGDLIVGINPELGIEIDGVPHVVKLYMKSEKLSKLRIEQVLCLMELALRKSAGKDVVFAILDIREGKLYSQESKDTSLKPLLEGEALSFASMWNSI